MDLVLGGKYIVPEEWPGTIFTLNNFSSKDPQGYRSIVLFDEDGLQYICMEWELVALPVQEQDLEEIDWI